MERRSRDRVETDLQVTCRVPAVPHRARVLDLSRGGCRMAVSGAITDPGVSVTVDLGKGVQARGTIVWSTPREAGVKFLPPLGQTAAVALGLEEQPVEVEEAYEPVDERKRGLLHHWFRTLTDSVAPKRKAKLFIR